MKIMYLYILLVTTFIAFSFKDDCGSYRWLVKTCTDKDGPAVFYSPATNSSLLELINEIRPFQNFERDPGRRYQDEHRKVRINVTIVKIKMETQDHDFHIVLQSDNHTMVGEVPDGYCGTFNDHPDLRKHFNELRQQIIAAIGFTPMSYMKPVNRMVTIEGIPFWDEFTTQHKPTGSALNQHEIHPITKITFN